MDYLHIFKELLETIPGTFWGVVVGSFFTLFGILITNRANDRRLAAQLKHDREMKRQERELALRRDIYLGVAEAISNALNAVSQMSNLDIPLNKLSEEYSEKQGAIAKIHVVAKESTARAMATFAVELGAAYLRLTARRVPLTQEKQQIENLKAQADLFGKERDRWLEEIKQYNLNGTHDQRRWDLINTNFQFEQGRVSETLAKANALAVALRSKNIELVKIVVVERNALNKLLLPVISSVRGEMGFAMDMEAYSNLFAEAANKSAASITEFLEKIAPKTEA